MPRPLLLSALVLSLLMLLSGCRKERASADESAGQGTASSQPSDQAQFFTVAADQMAHVQVVTVKTTNLPRTLRLTGTVAYNSFVTTPVISQISGPITRILVYPGQTVLARQPMLYVSSPDYAQLRDNYLKTRDAYNLAHKIYLRSQDLYAHHAIAAQELEQADSAQNQAQADLEAARQSLKIVGIANPDQVVKDSVSPEIPLRAPVDGEVVERLVAPGQVVQGGSTQCFTISDMRTVWVLANVYQNDLAYVHQGDAVSIETNAYPEVFHGRISYLAPAMDPTSRTLQVRIVTQNPGQKLKKDMYVTVTVNAGAIQKALAVPDAAVLRNSENQPFVYAVAGPGQFAQRLITIGETHGGRTQVLSGLQAGEQVVADGSLFLQFANSFQR
ncbi:MAG: efflux RND transporter periplasmic adaptor subunit [Terriglobia bacterium]